MRPILRTPKKSIQSFGGPRMANMVHDVPGFESKMRDTKSNSRKPIIQTLVSQKARTPINSRKTVVQTLSTQKRTKNTAEIQPVETLSTHLKRVNKKPVLTDHSKVKVTREKSLVDVSDNVNDQMINAYTSPEIIKLPKPTSETMSQVKKVAVGFGVTTVLSIIIKKLL